MFPQVIGIGATFNPELVSQMGEAVSEEARAKHVHELLRNGSTGRFHGLSFYAPNINVFRDPRWGRGQETYGEDPFLISVMGTAYMRSLQFGNDKKYRKLIATCKHFEVYNLESYYGNPQYRLQYNALVNKTDLYQTYRPAFETCIHANVSAIMCAYNAVNGIPNCASPAINSYLRDELGFDGYVISDMGAIEYMVTEHKYVKTIEQASIAGLNAGVDLDLGFEYLGLKPGDVSSATMETSLRRVITKDMEVGHYDPWWEVSYNNVSMDVIDSIEHKKVARRIVEEGTVLLKNSGILPLNRNGLLRNVAVIGPNANRLRSLVGNYNPCQISYDGEVLTNVSCTPTTPLEGLVHYFNKYNATVTHAHGCDINSTNTTGFSEAETIAAQADLVVAVMGLSSCTPDVGHNQPNCPEAEARDRTEIGFPGVQEQLIRTLYKANPSKLIVVLINGGPISIPSWMVQDVPAILEMWYPGEMAGEALGRMLFGESSPSGKLPVTIYEGLQQLPKDYLSMWMNELPGRTYRYFTETPLYPFGYGLSYTTFTLFGFEINPSRVNQDFKGEIKFSGMLANTGNYEGQEVIQLYIQYQGKNQGKAEYPLRELKGFVKVRLDKAHFEGWDIRLKLKDIRLVGPEGNYRVLEGTYKVWVGGSAPVKMSKVVAENSAGLTNTLVGEFEVL